MKNNEWDRLPKLKPVENLKEMGEIPIELYSGVFAMAKELSEKWIENRTMYSKQTNFQEDLVALILTVAISYATQELHAPGKIAGNPSNSAVDRIIAVPPKRKTLAKEVDGSTIQIVSTVGLELNDGNANPAILDRVNKKHKKGKTYSEGIQLAIFVTQQDWKIDVNKLISEIEKDKHYASYWVVLPLEEDNGALFVVNYLGLNPQDRGQGQIVVDINRGIRARYLGLYKQDGRLDDVKDYIEYFRNKS